MNMTPEERSAQWAAFDQVLIWIQSQEPRLIKKSDLYHAVMDMRPEKPRGRISKFIFEKWRMCREG